MIPCAARADLRQWIPRIVDYEADLEIYSTYENNNQKINNLESGWHDLFIREMLNLRMNGFVYHPRFIQYYIELSGGLKQETYEANSPSVTLSSDSTNSALGYNIRAKILPEHPYNLELFTIRTEPLTRQGLATGPSSVGFTKGAIFKYKERPFFVTASYTDTTIESDLATTDYSNFLVNANYYKQYKDYKSLSFNGTYRHFDSSTTMSQFKSSGNEAALTNTISLGKSLGYLTIGSGLRYVTAETGPFNSDAWSWGESLTARLPWNFNVAFSNSLSESTSQHLIAGVSGDIKTTTDNFLFNLTQKLYNSLQTSYTFNYYNASSSLGDSKVLSNSLNFGYAKDIPWGRLFAGVGLTRSTSERTGTTPTLDVSFHQNVPKFPADPPFTLSGENVDGSSITVFMKNPDVPGDRILLTRDVHYVVTPFGTSFRIEVIQLPPGFLFGPYDFLVSYTLISADVKFEQRTFNLNLSLELLQMLYPFYTHIATSQETVSGFIDRGTFDDVSDTVGISVVLLPFRFNAQYTKVTSDVVPWSGWLTEISYDNDVTPTIRLNAKASYTENSYPEGTSGIGVPYTEKIVGGLVGISKRLPLKGMYGSLSGSYWQRTQNTSITLKSHSYTANASFTWKLRRFLLELGANAYFVKSDSDFFTNEQTHQFYYLRIKRPLI